MGKWCICIFINSIVTYLVLPVNTKKKSGLTGAATDLKFCGTKVGLLCANIACAWIVAFLSSTNHCAKCYLSSMISKNRYSSLVICCRNCFVQALDNRKGQQKYQKKYKRRRIWWKFMVATSHWILISGFLLTYIWSTKTQSCPVHLWLVSLLTRWLSTPLSQHNILSCISESEFTEDGELSHVDYLYLQMNATINGS
jgi:hypothetical protein